MQKTIPYTDRRSPDLDAFRAAARDSIAVDHGNASDDPNQSHSIGVGIILGIIVGGILGVAMLLYVDSTRLNHWPGMASLIVSSAFGWALFGMIVGSGGVFSGIWRKFTRKRPL
jgi:formate/nitrite transporter FocA (FNT family)